MKTRCEHPIKEEYKNYGFQANQDFPGNFLWKDLYNASPNAKVILTVRDSEIQWKNSWLKFNKKIFSDMGNPGFWMVFFLTDYKFMGPKWEVMMGDISKFIVRSYLSN